MTREIKKPMFFAGLSRVKNESDIIEAFVRHNAALLDQLIIVDNDSCDGTAAILRSLEQEGLPLIVLTDETFGYFQSEIMTYLARATLAATGIDRLFLLDADEFLVARSRDDLEKQLATIPYETHALLPCKTYVPTPEDVLTQANPVARMTRRLTREHRQFYKVALSRSFLYAPYAVITQGNHNVESEEPDTSTFRLPGVPLAHFPIRSIEQMQRKALVGWSAYMVAGVEERGGYQWRALFERLTCGRAWSKADFYEFAAGYPEGPIPPQDVELVDEPLPADYAMRYLELANADPLFAAAATIESLSRHLAAAHAGTDPA